jgi:hypothetical protein
MLRPEIKSSNNAVFQASSVIAVNGDKVTIDKYAIVCGNGQLFAEVRILRLPCCYFLMQSQISIGKIIEIVVSESTSHLASHIVIRSLHFLPDIHPQL